MPNSIYRLLLLSSLFLYLLWLFRLIIILFQKRPEIEKIRIRYLLIGQLIGVVFPIVVLTILWIFHFPIRLHFFIPLAILFPASLFLSLHSARKKQLQSYVIQREKRIAFGTFMSGLEHEMKNPLTLVASGIDPLKEILERLKQKIGTSDAESPHLFEDAEVILKHMENGAARAEELVKELRRLPSADVDQKEEIDLTQLLEQCLDRLIDKWKEKIRIQKDFHAVPKILGRARELEEAFYQLISNACDATPQGGIVHLTTQEVTSGIKVTIQDTGKGIPRNAISRIFDPFFTTKAQGEGKGLGLAVALQMIKNHKGSIEVLSDEGRGTEFMVFLPFS